LHLKLIIINQKALIKFQVFLLFQILKIYSYQRQFQKVYYNLSLSDYYRLNLFSISFILYQLDFDFLEFYLSHQGLHYFWNNSVKFIHFSIILSCFICNNFSPFKFNYLHLHFHSSYLLYIKAWIFIISLVYCNWSSLSSLLINFTLFYYLQNLWLFLQSVCKIITCLYLLNDSPDFMNLIFSTLWFFMILLNKIKLILFF
jgi:hypothetical protein